MTEPHPPLSFSRVFKVVLPVALVGIAAYWWSSRLESAARREMADNNFARILGSATTLASSKMRFPDKDGDLVADPPADEECVAPEALKFSYVAGEEESVPAETWDPLIKALAEKTGREVTYVHYSTTEEQLAALKKGEVHIIGLNTGAVPAAVGQYGFVPVCTLGHEDGTFGYTMKLLVPADSDIKKPADIRGHKVTFTRPDSNSGCKAPLVLLREFELLPDQDYDWGFSMGHDESIKGVAAKDFDAAPVASDMLARAIENGEVEEGAIRTIYESERFPPAAIGYAYNLTPELREAISETLLNFNWKGTPLQEAFAAEATKFVPVNYKDDWANIRRIDQTVAQAQKGA